jgi:hypothetical protein
MMLPINPQQMTSSENDYTARMKPGDAPKEKNVAAHNRRKFNTVPPNGPIDKPPVTLPIIDTETNAAGDEIDTSNNYTAAENDHNTNTTL